MVSSCQELLLALSAPILALLVLLCWGVLRVRATGATNLHLRFLGLSLDIRTCSRTERECRAMQIINDTQKGT